MKNLVVVISVGLAILSAFLLVRKNYEAELARHEASQAQNERRRAITRESETDRKNKTLKAELQARLEEASAQSIAAYRARNASSAENLSPSNARPADILFRDPAMRDALLDQARESNEKQVKALFRAGLAQRLGLNETQTGALADILMQRNSLLTEQIYIPMMLGNVDAETMAVSGRATRASYDENTVQLRALLGDEGFDSFQKFEKTQPERENLQRFVTACADNGLDLSPEQQPKLLDVMSDERLNFKPAHDIGDPAKWDFEHWYQNFSDEKLEAYGTELTQLNDRMVQRAKELLTPEQSSMFQQMLTRQLNQAKFVVRSTTALFGRRQ